MSEIAPELPLYVYFNLETGKLQIKAIKKIKDPEVALRVLYRHERRFCVWGEVGRP
jgi:hypothetical protein